MENKEFEIAKYLIQQVSPSQTKLLKLLYICELFSIDQNRKRFTKLQFIHYHHGPYINGFIDELFMSGKVCLKGESTLSLCGDEKIKLTQKEKTFLDIIIKKYGPMALGEKNGNGILNYVYHTIPFYETGFGETINFERFKSYNISEISIKSVEYKRVKERVQKSRSTYEYLTSAIGMKNISEEIDAYLSK